ncbi:MAG: hypothetical protein WC794_05145 [Candidatus Doudnabacteria bacterium]|jgi:hypothetical protein
MGKIQKIFSTIFLTALLYVFYISGIFDGKCPSLFGGHYSCSLKEALFDSYAIILWVPIAILFLLSAFFPVWFGGLKKLYYSKYGKTILIYLGLIIFVALGILQSLFYK